MSNNPVKKSKIKTALSALTIIALLVFVYALRHQIVDTFINLKNVNPWALMLIPLLQIVNYHAYTRMYEDVYAILGEKIAYKKLLRVQLELNFVNNVFPSGGVSGISYFGLRMRSFGVGAGKSTLVQVIKFGLIFISFQIMLAAGLLMLAIGGRANNLLILIAGSLASFLFMGTVLVSYILSSKQRISSFFAFLTRVLNKIILVVRPGHPETIKIDRVKATFDELHDSYMLIKSDFSKLKKPLLFALLANTTEVLTIYAVYMAFNQLINPGAVIIAYAVSNFAGLVSVLPGGIGVYEALMTGTLVAAGVPAALSLPVTVMYRILNSLIQLPPGYYFYHKTLHAPAHEDS
jgi:uncharacterized protein (TIRG00374 family)